MNTPEFFESMKELDSLFQEYFEKDDFDETIYRSITKIIQDQKIHETKTKHKILLNLLANIITYHRVGSNFTGKFEKIIQFLDIFKTFSIYQVYKIFRFSRRSIYYFFQKKLIEPNDQMFKNIVKNKLDTFLVQFIPSWIYTYKNYNTSAVQPPLAENSQELFEIGENDNISILSLIRKDSIIEFITHITKNSTNLNSIIYPSIYETNPFLIGKNVTLIQYAAFYGSIQIFRYLMMNSVELDSSLWHYAIHGRNPELIHLLESNEIQPEKKDNQFLIEECIRCHYSDLANYLINLNPEFKKESFYRFAYTYYNFEFFLHEMNYGYIFLFACDYEYFDIVKDIIQLKDFNQHEELIFTYF